LPDFRGSCSLCRFSLSVLLSVAGCFDQIDLEGSNS